MLLAGPAAAPFRDLRVGDLPACLDAGDLLVVNDTRVLPARLCGTRHRAGHRARLAITLLRPGAAGVWHCLARPLKRLRPGDGLEFGDAGGVALAARVLAVAPPGATLAFDRTGEAFRRALDRVGEIPLPPYITRQRAVDERDREHYQTVFAAAPGAVAAPTAGLHFDAALLAALAAAGIGVVRVTLHVGGATFLPIRPGATPDAVGAERGRISPPAAAAIRAARARGSRVVAVGTTALRLLETVALADPSLPAWEGETTLFLRPGHRFRVADGLFTNFHLPHSTLFVLACAFLGTDRCRAAYRHALAHGYRFYSYGDASLLLHR